MAVFSIILKSYQFMYPKIFYFSRQALAICVMVITSLLLHAQPAKKNAKKEVVEKGKTTKIDTKENSKNKKKVDKAIAEKTKTDKNPKQEINKKAFVDKKKGDAKVATDKKKMGVAANIAKSKDNKAKELRDAKAKEVSTKEQKAKEVKAKMKSTSIIEKSTNKLSSNSTKGKAPLPTAINAPAIKTAIPKNRSAKKIADSIAREKWLIKKNALLQKEQAIKEQELIAPTLVIDNKELPIQLDAEDNKTVPAALEMPIVPSTPNQKLINVSEDIVALFAEEDYRQVAKLGANYIVQVPNDTVIIIKTGLSNLFETKFKEGFSLIDKTLLDKDTLVRFYSTVPYIYKAAKGNEVQKEIVKHCKDINANNVWTHFAETSYFNNTDNEPQALKSGEKMHQLISNISDADALGFLYPLLLQKYGQPEKAIEILEASAIQFPSAYGLKFFLFEHYRKKRKNIEAYTLIKELSSAQPANEEFMESKIEMCMLLGKNQEACDLLKTANQNYLLDDKVFKVGCAEEFYKIPLQSQATYIYKVNKNGNLYNTNLTLEPMADNNLTVNYKTETKKAVSGAMVLESKNFDTCRTLNFDFFSIEKNEVANANSILWLSKVCFNELVNNKQVYLDIGKGLGLFTIVENEYFTENEDQNLFMDRIAINENEQKFVSTLHLYNTETAEQLWVLDDVKNPLIVKMDGAFTVELSKVFTK
jgi:hypothetical protein